MCTEKRKWPEEIQNERKLTIEELRKYKGCERLSVEEATRVCDELYRLSLLCYTHYSKNHNKRHNNGTGSI